MIGLAILGAAALYCVIWAVAFKMVPTLGAKVLVALVALGIPTWDIPVGYYNFRTLCEREGGLRVLEKFEPQDVVHLDHRFPGSVPDLLDAGFRYVEYDALDGRTFRYTRSTDKRPIGDLVSQRRARIRVSADSPKPSAWNLVRYDSFADELGSHRVLVRFSSFSWRGGWLIASVAPLLGPGESCWYGQSDEILRALRAGMV